GRLTAGNRAVNAVVGAVNELYKIWRTRIGVEAEIHVAYRRPYFISEGVLRRTAGLVQIRDFATETNDTGLLDSFQQMRGRLAEAKDEFYELLRDRNGINYFGPAAAGKTVGEAVSAGRSKFEEVLERRLTLAGAIVRELESDKNLGRTKLAKVFYLADVSQRLSLNMNYYRQPAGPLDARALYNEKMGVEAVGAKRGYFSSTGDGRFIRYERGRRLEDLLKKAPEMFGRKWEGIRRVIGLCEGLSTEQCEIMATLYACWNDLLIEGKDVTDDAICRDFLVNWHEKKRRFAKQRLIRALGWMRQEKLIPEGLGEHTKEKRSE
ncbi:MAG: hypothetical protein ACREQV_09660, partial [Candidatus Binatia bacterium]